MSFAQGLARGLSDMPNTIRRGQEQRRMRDLGDQLTSGIEEGLTPDSAKNMAAVLARDGHVDAAMRMLEKGASLERQGKEDEWTDESRSRVRTEWGMEDDLREWKQTLAEMEALPPGQAGPAIERAYSKFPDGHKGRVVGYDPETRKYLMERDDGETWEATLAEVLERSRALSNPQAFLEAKRAAEVKAAKRKEALDDRADSQAHDLNKIDRQGMWRSGQVQVGEDAEGNPIYGPGRGISGAKGPGANHTAVKQANDTGFELLQTYVNKGKPIPPAELRLWNEQRAAAGLPPVTNTMVKDPRFWQTEETTRREKPSLQFGEEPTGISGGAAPPEAAAGGGDLPQDTQDPLGDMINQVRSKQSDQAPRANVGMGAREAQSGAPRAEYVTPIRHPETPPVGIGGRAVSGADPSAVGGDQQRVAAINQAVRTAGRALLPVANLIETRYKGTPEAMEISRARAAQDFQRLAAAVASAAAKSSEAYEALTGGGAVGVAEYKPEAQWGAPAPWR